MTVSEEKLYVPIDAGLPSSNAVWTGVHISMCWRNIQRSGWKQKAPPKHWYLSKVQTAILPRIPVSTFSPSWAPQV
jgi:hypothetical protein